MSAFTKLADAMTTVTASDVTTFEFGGGGKQDRPKGTGVMQVSIVGTSAALDVEGRMSSDLPWVALKNYTADAIDEVVLCPEMRVNITAVTAATVDVWIIP